MARKVNQERRELWRQRIERQGDSGLTVAEFCRREGVPQGSFYSWKRKLRGKSRSKSRRPRSRQTAVPVRLASQAAFVQLPVSSARVNPWIELVLVEGTIIRLPQQNLAARQMVLRALGGNSQVLASEET